MESGVCGCASEFDIAGIGVSVHEVAEKDKRPSPTVSWLTRKQSRRQKLVVHEKRQGKAVKKSSTVVTVFKCDRFPPTHPDAQEREVLWARISRGVSVGTSFRFTKNMSEGHLRPTLMHTKNLYENGPNPFFSGFFNLMGTRMVQIRMAKSV